MTLKSERIVKRGTAFRRTRKKVAVAFARPPRSRETRNVALLQFSIDVAAGALTDEIAVTVAKRTDGAAIHVERRLLPISVSGIAFGTHDGTFYGAVAARRSPTSARQTVTRPAGTHKIATGIVDEPARAILHVQGRAVPTARAVVAFRIQRRSVFARVAARCTPRTARQPVADPISAGTARQRAVVVGDLPARALVHIELRRVPIAVDVLAFCVEILTLHVNADARILIASRRFVVRHRDRR